MVHTLSFPGKAHSGTAQRKMLNAAGNIGKPVPILNAKARGEIASLMSGICCGHVHTVTSPLCVIIALTRPFIGIMGASCDVACPP